MSFQPLRRVGTTDFQLRPATNADAAAARELIFVALREHGLRPDPDGTDADLADIEGQFHQRGGRFDVLVNAGGEIVGTVALFRWDDATVELRKMYLRADHRHRGLGRLLLAHALNAARELGFRRMTLETATVLREAIQLYEHHGFRRAARRGPHSCRCDVVMERELG
jgi:putative acetyltransferase